MKTYNVMNLVYGQVEAKNEGHALKVIKSEGFEPDEDEYAINEEQRYDILESYNKLKKEFEDYKNTSISWGVEDFEHRAVEKEEWHGEDIYDRSKFKDALNLMIHQHDANTGISWDTIDVYLSEYCRKPEQNKSITKE